MVLEGVDYLSRCLLHQYRHQGALVVLARREWIEEELQTELECGPHQSTMDHGDFLKEDFISVDGKGQWMLLP